MHIFLASVSLLLASSAGLAAAPLVAQPRLPIANATASTTERLDLARRFVALSNQTDDFMALVEQGFWHGASAQLEGIEDKGERANVRAKAATLLIELKPKIRARMPELLDAYARAYAEKFTAAELGELVGFASTPTGKRYLLSVDALDFDPAVVEVQSTLGDDLVPVMQEFQKQVCAERAKKRIAMGDKTAECSLSKSRQSRSL